MPPAVPLLYEGGISASPAEASANNALRATGLAPAPCLPASQKGLVSSPCTYQGTQFSPGGTLFQAGQYLLRQVPEGLDVQSPPQGIYVCEFPIFYP